MDKDIADFYIVKGLEMMLNDFEDSIWGTRFLIDSPKSLGKDLTMVKADLENIELAMVHFEQAVKDKRYEDAARYYLMVFPRQGNDLVTVN